jgi:hypothetical protein
VNYEVKNFTESGWRPDQSGVGGLLRRGRGKRLGAPGLAHRLAAAPGGAAPEVQIIKKVNVSQEKEGEPDQGAQALEREQDSQALGSEKSKKQPEKKREEVSHGPGHPSFCQYSRVADIRG